jgi:hypothetical protein
MSLLFLFSTPRMVRCLFWHLAASPHVLLLFWTHYSSSRLQFAQGYYSLTRSLCDQTFIHPLHWLKATNFPESATHAIDFGPGGLNGIGPLTARNFEGRGVHVIVLGEKGRGSYELYDSKSVKFEDWWTKKWTPKLVKTRYVAFLVILHAKPFVLTPLSDFGMQRWQGAD